MFRTAFLVVAIAAALTSSAVGQRDAAAQTPAPATEFNQTLLDRWLVAAPAMAALNASANAPKTDEDARPHMERICADAGFASFEQCGTTIAYAGILFSGFDPRTRSFKDPASMMRARIAEIETNTQMPPQAKESMLAQMKEAAAGFPKDIPEAHLRLMADNRDRIFKALGGNRKR
jgi:hypothetical protein